MANSGATRLRAVSEWVEAALLGRAVRALQWLSPEATSNLGGALARKLGPWLPISRVADDNLRRALPELDATARARVIRGVWDNLGRTAAELPHLASFRRTDAGPGWEIEGEAHVERLRDSGGQALFFSGHFGNWELILPVAASLGLPVAGVYRTASNAAVNQLIQSLRQKALGHGVVMFPKGALGARAALLHLREIELHLGYLDAMRREFLLRPVIELGGFEQSLGGNASRVQAGTPEGISTVGVLPFVHAGHGELVLTGANRRRIARGTRSDHDHIVAVAHTPSTMRAGSSRHCLTVTRNCTASRPSMIRWS